MKYHLPHYIFALASLALSLASHADEQIATVLFAIGDAKVVSHGASTPVTKGYKLEVGDELSTGKDGHIQVRFVDSAFVAVRPSSKLHIDAYLYSPSNPADSRVKFSLETGTVRSITGEAGHAAKENFRFNTPIAAIGVRGTDFVVSTTAAHTRVSVQEGAVVLSPLGAGCTSDGSGPCNTPLSRQLTGSMANMYLELRSHSSVPILKTIDENAPNNATPPRPDELHPAGDKPGKSGNTTDARAVTDVVAQNALQVVASDVRETPAAAIVPAPPPATIWWGRWAVPAGQPGNVVGLLQPGREMTVGNTTFGMVRDGSPVNLPTNGIVSFKLADSEAYLIKGNALNAASLIDPHLSIDFAARQFSTSVTLQQGGATVPVVASGQVTWQGYLFADPARSNAALTGVLTGQGEQAGYIFSRTLGPDTSAVGATRWTH